MEFNFKEPKLEIVKILRNTNILREYLIEHRIPNLQSHLLSTNELTRIHEINTKIVEEIAAKRAEDPENESHLLECDRMLGEHYAATLDIKEMEDIMSDLEHRSTSTSLLMDMQLCRMRVAMIIRNEEMLRRAYNKARELSEKACDWDRRNKFKVYDALYLLTRRRLSESAKLFAETLPTFESSELISYDECVLYAIFTGLISFSREEIRKKIVENSEILEINKGGHGISTRAAYSLSKTFYGCDYQRFLIDLSNFADSIRDEIYLRRLVDFFVKEMKIKAYRQLLDSYKSLSIHELSNVFGISEEFLERDISNYIVDGRIQCVIDRVERIIMVSERNKCDEEELIKKGEELIRLIKSKI
ncbi:26S proteasome regulatory subunit RPN7 [Astathelohania contejeani]|uniref:26S proteasome regulatory subunit RPN7 n=1 Tax=Astathelohania contejeani TaxID=164912 RepID=A0ABQ7HVR3_9MICR|nr:26S proteasome regulatory subunit RPN7 [Thelohania contejeani]